MTVFEGKSGDLKIVRHVHTVPQARARPAYHFWDVLEAIGPEIRSVERCNFIMGYDSDSRSPGRISSVSFLW